MPLHTQGKYPQILYANLPACSLTLIKFLATDIARGGTLFRSDGTNWVCLSGANFTWFKCCP